MPLCGCRLLGALLVSWICLKGSSQQPPDADFDTDALQGPEVEPCGRITNCAVMFVRKFRTYLFNLAGNGEPEPAQSSPRTVSLAEVTSSGEVLSSEATTGSSNTTCESVACLGTEEAPLLRGESGVSQEQRRAPSRRHSRTPALPGAAPSPSAASLGGGKAFRAAEQPGTAASEYNSTLNATARHSAGGAALGQDSIGLVAMALFFALLALICMFLSRRVLVVYTNKMSV